MNRKGLRLTLDSFWRVALLVLALRFASGQTALLAYFLVVFYGVRGPRQALEAFLLSWFITMANANIFAPVAGGSLGRFIVIFVVSGTALLRFSAQNSKRVSHFVLATLLFSSYIIIHSVLFSPMTLISLLKGLSWMLVMLTTSLSMFRLSRDQFQLFEKHTYGFLVLVTLLCIPTFLLFPGGQMVGYGFLRGMLGHSQATGALASLLGIWAFSRVLDKPHRTTMDFVIFGMAFAVAFLSGTRTAVVSLIIAMVAAFFSANIHNRRPLQKLLQKISTPVGALSITAVLLASIINGETILNSFSDFLNKNSDTTSFAEAYEASRGELIDRMYANITTDPIVGIGFGIASDPETMIVERVAGVPVSALVEKGVAHIAIWEELGIFGLLLYVYWIILLFSKGLKANATQFSVLMTIFLLNFGDAYIFSPGGMGMLMMVLIAFGSHHDGSTKAGTVVARFWPTR